ncbi:hypothetical protein AB0C59_01855 [Streptomyces sp. NPDC048664]|uniref:hypothetical protein n=1 Tax=Streptomyces sp. NPDC048664 TaxID=3154505 RepID=UPI0034349381
MTVPERSPVWPVALLASLVGLVVLATAGFFVFVVRGMSDPVPPYVGFRVEGNTIDVKFPVCPSDVVHRVEVRDFTDTNEEPRLLWWASEPTAAPAAPGVVRLWSGEGFARHAPASAPSAPPRVLDVSYAGPSGRGASGVLDLREASAAKTAPGQYWTEEGSRTAEQIDAQLHCRDHTAG